MHQAGYRSWVERCIYGEMCAVLPWPRLGGHALGLQNRELWQITKGRRSDLTRNGKKLYFGCVFTRIGYSLD